MRHKQWASCSGIRDPAAYVKRSDLATPKGIDHDYNYLTSIERQFDIAERALESRGIRLYDENRRGARKRGLKSVRGQLPLENAIKQRRVVVDKAPKGMSRQKQNATCWDKNAIKKLRLINRAKRMVWTIEWVHKNGSKEIGQCPETESIDAAYNKIVTARAAAEAERPNKKLKVDTEISRPAALATIPQPKGPPTIPRAQAPVEQLQLSEPSSSLATDHHPSATLEGDAAHGQPPSSVNIELPFPPPRNFYLLLPSTPTSYRVLIPLSPTDTLATALTDRLVLEFPTIYALKQPPNKLPTGFMTEDEYLKGIAQKGSLDGHLDGLFHGEGGLEHVDTNGYRKQDLNECALRDVLKKDLVREVDVG
ncbi:MAG: hypothetical protein Q9196_005487 [Gyalolechia fulgens]